MKRYQPLACLLGALAISATIFPAQAQNARAPVEIQKDYDQFIVKFRDALKANDGNAVTDMTAFPFYWNDMRDAAYFRKNLYGKIFTPKVRDCLARGKGGDGLRLVLGLAQIDQRQHRASARPNFRYHFFQRGEMAAHHGFGPFAMAGNGDNPGYLAKARDKGTGLTRGDALCLMFRLIFPLLQHRVAFWPNRHDW